MHRVFRERILAAALVALSAGSPAPRSAHAAEAGMAYQCPPCPQGCDEATYDHPGKCPVCGMDLVAKTGEGSRPAAAPASAPPPAGSAVAPCSGAEFGQLDFWIGEWDASWPASPGTPAGTGTNRIEKILDGCVVSENFAASGPGALVGRSYSTYSARTKRWQQTWVDNQGSYLALDGDLSKPDDRVLEMETTGKNGKPIRMRMVFANISREAFDWRWERSVDGGKIWSVQWPIHYTRKKGA